MRELATSIRGEHEPSSFMMLLGLTGGVGMGKSTVATLLRESLSLPVIDTDVIARELVEPGQDALREIKARWGDAVIGRDGRLLRGALAELVFADAAARQELEAILHPRIRQAWLAQAQLWRAQGCPAGVVVIPLLFETGAQNDLDRTLCIACSARTQLDRLRSRGWTVAQSAQRIAAQWPIDKKMALADYVVWNEGTLEIQRQQLERILGGLRAQG